MRNVLACSDLGCLEVVDIDLGVETYQVLPHVLGALWAITAYLLHHAHREWFEYISAHVFINGIVDWLEGKNLLRAMAALCRTEANNSRVVVCLLHDTHVAHLCHIILD